MARPIRITGPGLWHHVMNRGAGRSPIFVDDEERLDFLDLLTEISARWGVHTHAMALMGNHYHLLLHDQGDALSRAMGHLNQLHTQWFNQRRGRDGSLFRGRFYSRLVQKELYLAEVVRYIHANPVGARMVKRAGDYAWSSHHVYLSGARPDWLHKSEVLRLFGGDTPEGREQLDAFVHARVPAEVRKALEWKRTQPILGDEAFVEAHREQLRATHGGGRSGGQASSRWIRHRVADVIRGVCEQCGVAEADIRRGVRGRTNAARQAAIVLCVEMTGATAHEIAEALDAKPHSLSALASKYRKRASADPDFGQLVSAIRDRIRSQGSQ